MVLPRLGKGMDGPRPIPPAPHTEARRWPREADITTDGLVLSDVMLTVDGSSGH